MPGFLSRWAEWFRALSSEKKLGTIIVAVVVFVLASPVLKWVAALAVLPVIVVIIVRAVRRAPIRSWALALVGLVVAFIIASGLASAVYGPSERGAQVPAVRTPEPADPETEPAPEPEPPTPQRGTLTVEAALSAIEAEGYYCDSEPSPRAGRSSWSCLNTGTAKSYTATIYAPDPNAENVTMVEADVNGSVVSVGEAGGVLGEIAAMPNLTVEGENQAREWTANNIATVDAGPDLEDIMVSTTVEGVRYELHGGAPSYRLLVLKLPP